MNPQESYEIRCEMAKMHDAVLTRIEEAYKNDRYIEVCWLCYACFESRVNRVLSKMCSGCTKEKRNENRHIGIVTKLECYIRLIKNKYPPLEKESIKLLRTVKTWCKARNKLIHGLVSLEYYNDADKKFKELAQEGRQLVSEMYSLGKDVREYYYEASAIPMFDTSVVDKCKLDYKCIRE